MFERALSWARGFVLVLPVLLPGCYDGAPAPEVAPAVDLQRFTGKWYEIAKLPRTTEAHCTGTVATYQRRSDGDLEMTSQCRLDTLDGPSKSVTAIAKIPDPAVPAKLALAVGGFYGDYWILEVGTNYEYAVIGQPVARVSVDPEPHAEARRRRAQRRTETRTCSEIQRRPARVHAASLRIGREPPIAHRASFMMLPVLAPVPVFTQ